MKQTKNGFILILALIAISFTFISRSEALKTIHYKPESDCYGNFFKNGINYKIGDFSYTTNPTAAGCGVPTNTVKQINNTKPFFGDLLSNPLINPVSSVGTVYMAKCDETLSVVCCIHINPTNLQILDVCSGRQVAN